MAIRDLPTEIMTLMNRNESHGQRIEVLPLNFCTVIGHKDVLPRLHKALQVWSSVLQANHIILVSNHRLKTRADMMMGLTSDFLRVFAVGIRK